MLSELFSPWKITLGCDYKAYHNHVLRVLAFYELLTGEAASEKIQLAAFFHDLGIWSDQTLDYIPPSLALAKAFLEKQNKSDWIVDVTKIIAEHHKITPFKGSDEVEFF